MSSRRVLVVEDDEATRALLLHALRDEGFDPVGAANGLAALDLLAEEDRAGREPALVLLDLYMPVMDGVSFARAYRERSREGHVAPILLLTAGRPTPEQLAAVGAAAFISKPFELDALFGSVHQNATASTTLRVLLVEDSDADARLVTEVLREMPEVTLEHAADGAASLRALEREAEGAEPYGLVLLDLNLPRLDGFAVLDTIKSNPALRRLPVVVITGSDDGEHVSRAYDARANGYVVKSADLDTMRDRILGTIRFWLLARLPRSARTGPGTTLTAR
ncbi:MAG TPA: response regulator [Chloroflexota bacterium]|nr:response regulator [Chloroflexota bacterium]